MDRKPRVVRFTALDTNGQQVPMTVGTDIIDQIDSARTFGRDDMADPKAPGRFQRRVVAIPDRRGSVVTPMVLTMSSQNGLYLVRKDEGGSGAWQLTDLGLTGVQAVSAAWTDDDKIAVVVAVAAAPGSTDSRVLAAYNLTSKSTDWSQIKWTDCGTRAGVRVEAIRVLDEGDGTWTVVLAGDRGPADMIYLLKKKTQTFGKAYAFNPAVTMQEILDMEVGVHPIYGGGLHVLGTSGSSRVLAFRPFPEYDKNGKPRTIPPVVNLPCPADANVLESGLTGPDGSDLYIGGQGVHLIPAAQLENDEKAAVTQVMSKTAAPNLQDVVIADNSDGSAAVWSLQQNGDLTVARKAAGGKWGNSVRIRTDVQEIAPVAGDERITTSVLVVYAGGQAAFLWFDKAAGIWQESPLLVTDPDTAVKTTCTATTLRVLNADGSGREGATVQVSASALSAVSINGGSYLIGPDVTITAQTDSMGGVTVLNYAKTLTPAICRFTVEGIKQPIDVNPAGGTFERFQKITADELRSEPGLLPEQYRTGGKKNQINALAGMLNQAGRIAETASGVKAGVRQTDARQPHSSKLHKDTLPDGYKWGITADSKGVRILGDQVLRRMITAAQSPDKFFEGLGESISDFFEGARRTAKNAITCIINKVQSTAAYEFICFIGDKVKRFVLNALEEIGPFMDWLWEQVETGLEAVWNFLKFMFSWEDILLVRDTMVDVLDNSIEDLIKGVDKLKSFVNSGFDEALGVVRGWREEAGLKPETARRAKVENSIGHALNKAGEKVQDALDAATGNSVVSWVVNQLNKAASEIVTMEGPNPVAELIEASAELTGGLLLDEITNLAAGFAQLGEDMNRIFSGEMPGSQEINLDTIKDALVIAGADVLDMLIVGIRDYVLRHLDFLGNLLKAGRDFLYAKIRFPFIEKLVELVVPGVKVNTSVRLIDALVLLAAIPATITYKLLVGEAPLKKGDVLPLPTGTVTVQSFSSVVRHWSWVGGLVGAFVKLGISGYKTFKAASESMDQNASANSALTNPAVTKLDTKEKVWVGFLAALSVLSVAYEYAGRDTGVSGDVEALEYTMVGLSGVMAVKTVAVAIYRIRYVDDPKLKQINYTLDAIGYAIHLILRTAAYACRIRDLKKESDPGDEIETETLSWMQHLFNEAGSCLTAAGGAMKDPETKAILLGFGSLGKLVAFATNLTRAGVSRELDEVLIW